MGRIKKDAINFGCKLDREVAEKLEEFCRMTGMNKTMVVERALLKYLEENSELAKEVFKRM